jgi:hypothetical protein
VSATADTPRRPAKAPPSGAADHLPGRGRPARPKPVALMSLEALTLAGFSILHLSGALQIGTGDSNGAGIAEAVICIALAGGAWALARSPAKGRLAALCAVYFAIAGFILGFTITVDSGDTIDLIYHATMLPILAATAALLAVRPRRRVQNAQNPS